MAVTVITFRIRRSRSEMYIVSHLPLATETFSSFHYSACHATAFWSIDGAAHC